MKNIWFTAKGIAGIVMLTGVFLIHEGCVKDNFDFKKLSTEVALNPSFATPLAYGSLFLGDIIKEDDSLIYHGDNNTIYILSQEDSVFSFQLSDFLVIPDQEYISTTFELQPAIINIDATHAIIPFESVVQNMDSTLLLLFQTLNGQYSLFPDISQNNLGDFEFDLIDTVKYVVFSEGMLFITMENKLPVEVQSISITIKNAEDNNGSIIGSFMLNNIEPDGAKTDSLNLSGIYLQSLVNIALDELIIVGSTNLVYIDLSDYFKFTLTTKDVKVIKGEAFIPSQVIHQQVKNIDITFSDDEQITLLHLNEAKLNYSAQLHTDEAFIISIVLPEVKMNDTIVRFQLETFGSGGVINGAWELNDAIFNLASNTIQPYNTFPVEYEVLFISSGEMTKFDLGEQYNRFLDLQITNIDFEIVRGYLGQKSINISNEVFDFDIDLLNKITGTSVLAKSKLKLFYEHSFGFPIQLFFDLTGQSPEGQIQLDYNEISFEAINNVGDIIYDSILINETNSNISEFIAFRPTSFMLTGDATSNPNGQTSQTNFIHSGSHFKAGFEIEMPLELQQLDIMLTDTIEIDLGSDLYENVDSITLNLFVKNGFPLSTIVSLTLFDSINAVPIHTFSQIALLNAAPVNDQGIVLPDQYTQSEVVIIIPPEVMSEMHRVNSIIISAGLNIPPQGQAPVKLLTRYRLDFTISSNLRLNL